MKWAGVSVEWKSRTRVAPTTPNGGRERNNEGNKEDVYLLGSEIERVVTT